MLRHLFTYFCLTSAAFTAAADVLYRGESELSVGFQEINYLPVQKKVLQLNDARAEFMRGHFTPNNSESLNLGIARDNYWVTFAVNNQAANNDANLFMVLGNPRLNEVQVFIERINGVVSHFRVGDNFSFGDRPINLNEFAIPLSIARGESVRVWMLVKHQGNTLQMPITLRDTNALLSTVETDYLRTGVVSGIFMIAGLFGIFFLFNTRDPLFISYSGYMLTAGLWVWTTEGFAFQYVWPDMPELATRLGPGISAVSACFFVANCLQFVTPYDQKSGLRKVLIGILVVLFLWSSTTFLPFIPINEKTMSVYLNVYFTMNVVTACLMCFYMLNLVLKGHTIVLYFFLAVVTTMASAVVVVLKGSGVIRLSFSSAMVMSIGYLVELVLMTLGITKQFYNYRKEKEETLLAFLDQQKSITQKILQTQETERQRIGRELHDDIGAGLTQISLMSEAARSYAQSSRNNLKELEDIAATSRNLVRSMGEIIWALQPDNKTLNQLLVYMREDLHKLLEYSSIDYEIDFPNVNEDIPLDNAQLRNILLIIKESVNNAVKYSHANRILISCEVSSGQVTFSVKDDGQGMDMAKVKYGNGLHNMQKRAQEIGGALSITSTQGKGTCNTLHLAVNHTFITLQNNVGVANLVSQN